MADFGGTSEVPIRAQSLPCCGHGLGGSSRGALLGLGEVLSREIKGGTSPVLTVSVPLFPCGAAGLEVLLFPVVGERGESKEQGALLGQSHRPQSGLLSITP